jgi:MraZ protein
VRTPFLYGEFELSVDAKNRLIVPSEIRRLIVPETDGDAFFVTMRSNVPWMYPEKYYEQLVSSQIRPDITPDEDLLAYAQLKFALASRLDWDAQGRMSVPPAMLKRAGITRDATLIGMQDHLELWNRTEWETRRRKLIEDSPDIERRAKTILQQKQQTQQPTDRS